MPAERSIRDVLSNLLKYGDLSFRDFVEIALYHPAFGYYSRGENRVGKEGDYVTAPTLSPVFSYAIGNLCREFMSRSEAAVCSIVDIGCGDGSLVRAVAEQIDDPRARFFGVDRSLSRVAERGQRVTFLTTIDEVPKDGDALVFSNELYDAFPFARLVQRGEHLHELWVNEELEWSEREAAAQYDDYFGERRIALDDGQFADVSLEWEAFHDDVVRSFERALIVTIDYGHPQSKLFHSRARRFGTAAAYAQQRVTRDLLANPGEQDLTAHINFTDLERAGDRESASTLFFDRLAKFLLTLGITGHELLRPMDEGRGERAEGRGRSEREDGSGDDAASSALCPLPSALREDDAASSALRPLPSALRGDDAASSALSPLPSALSPLPSALWQAREDARRLILPDGIGEDLRVLVQGKGVALDGWSFQKRLF
jgi:SAM-dependent MidA family methyltransferase